MTKTAKRLQLNALMIASTLALAACGGGGGDVATPPTTPVQPASNPITVTPSLGQFSVGTVVIAYRPDGTTEVARGTVDATGVAKIELGSYTGAVIVTVQGGAGVTYYDEHTNAAVNFPAGQTLSAVVPPSTANVGVTPLTEAAKQKLAAGTGGIAAATATDISTANKTVAAAFGLADALTPPTLIKDNTSKNTDNTDAGRYALVLAVIAGSGNTGVPAHEAAAALAKDFGADGKLDGKGTGGAAVANVDVSKLGSNFGASLAAAATTFAKPEVAAVIKAEASEIKLVTEPKAPDANTNGIKAARDVIADVRISARLAEGQLNATAQAVNDAVDAVSVSGRLGLEHFELLSMGGTYMWQLLDGDTSGAVRVQTPNGMVWKRSFPARISDRPPMDCFGNAADPLKTIQVVCYYGKVQGRNPEKPNEWSRIRIAFSKGANAGDLVWDAAGQTAPDESFSTGVSLVPYGGEQDGVFHFELSGDNTAQSPLKGKASLKGSMPYDRIALGYKQDIDLTVDASLAELSTGISGSAGIAGSVSRTMGEKTIKLEILPDSKIVADEAKNSVTASLGLKATVGAYTLSGALSLTDTATLYAATPAASTAKFTGSVVGTAGDSANVEATLTVKKLDLATDLHAGTVSLSAKVTTKDKEVIQLALGLDRPEAGKDVANLTVSQQLNIGTTTERKLSIGGKLNAGKLDGAVTISATRNGLAITATATKGSDGKLTGSVKAGDQEVGTISGNVINFKDGTSESLG